MATPKKNQTTQPVAEPAQRRESIRENPALFRRFRDIMLRNNEPFTAVTIATTAGYRVEREDLHVPYLDALERLPDEEERKLWRKLHAREFAELERAWRHLDRMEATGFNARTRASEAAAERAERERIEADRQAAIARTQAELDAEDAARDAAARRMRAEAVVDAAAHARARAAERA
jgi:hypothetical protein